MRSLVRGLLSTELAPAGKHFVGKQMTQYVLSLNRLYRQVATVPGHVVEFGVGSGGNAVLFGNLMDLYGDADIRHYYGFDTFGGYPREDLKSSPHLNADRWTDLDVEDVRETLRDYGVADHTTLVEGDLKTNFPAFVEERNHPRKAPGSMHIALCYVDCNSYRASKAGIEAALEWMSPGGIIACDELRQGGEMDALREVCDKCGLPFRRGEPPASWQAYTVVGDDGGPNA